MLILLKASRCNEKKIHNMIMNNEALHDSLPAYFSSLISCHSPLPSLHFSNVHLPSVSGSHPTLFQLWNFAHAVSFAQNTLAQIPFSWPVSLSSFRSHLNFISSGRTSHLSKGDLSYPSPLFSLRSLFISFTALNMTASYFIYIFIS